MTFVKTKLKIEAMAPGDVLILRLKGAEPLENVPRSLGEEGHTILSLEPENGPDRSETYASFRNSPLGVTAKAGAQGFRMARRMPGNE